MQDRMGDIMQNGLECYPVGVMFLPAFGAKITLVSSTTVQTICLHGGKNNQYGFLRGIF